MELNISYRHLESSPSIEDKIHQKAFKLKKFFQGKMNVDWICSVENTIHSSEVTVTGDHFSYHATAESDDLYKTFDEVIPKLEKQLVRKKEQTRNTIHKNAK
ncbi:MAG: ribosome-associated translation inhibitor RaiA [Bacteriovoracaceae bacterium]|nr:ribosome-associated translation inhibitor RaiA [Bacteriovoracaceae bacterium]